MEEFLETDLFRGGILPVLIFLARVADRSLATLRVVFVARGVRLAAAAAGFFETIVWLLAIAQVVHHLNHPATSFAYALGFAAGTYAGMTLERHLAIGQVIVRAFVAGPADALAERLRALGCGVTTLAAEGTTGPVELVFTVLRGRDLERVASAIRDFDAGAFYTIREVRSVNEGIFPTHPGRLWLRRSIGHGK